MDSIICNAASTSTSPFTTFSPVDTMSLEHQAGMQAMVPQTSLQGQHEDEGYASASLSPAPEEHTGSMVSYVAATNQPFQSDITQTEAQNDEEYPFAGMIDASGDVPQLDGPCAWSDAAFAVLVNCLSASLLPTQPLATTSQLDSPTSSSAALSPSYDHASAFLSTTLDASPGAGPSTIPQDALAMPAPSTDTPRQSPHKRSRSDEMHEALPPPPIKKLRAQGLGEVEDLQAAASWNAAGWVMPPGYYAAPPAPAPFMVMPPGYYAAPLVSGPLAFWPYPQPVDHMNNILNGEAPEQNDAHGDIPPAANADQAAGALVLDAPQNAQRPRRTNEDIAQTLIPGIRSGTCGFVGCEVTLDPKKGENNRKHIKAKHYSVTTLGSDAQVMCDWAGCGRLIRGKNMMAHTERDHIGYAYQCLVPGCVHAWKGSRAKDWTTHMNREHRGWRG
ncbi:hypothetical protein TRAPUB_2745 [Trametes pubescens]|uniref:C2H2-type domain-containing protein n=1 Tax=Trametes pubescens TaxID=154538 RepID=A0A1M2VFM1_TRAPU|nr:hypothetical protein TRAPUB_2745 [Trametes pubescens]